jgi:hypothetical protein
MTHSLTFIYIIFDTGWFDAKEVMCVGACEDYIVSKHDFFKHFIRLDL